MDYRHLTTSEIEQLKRQGCRAEDWQKISVAKDFCADHIQRVIFSGTVQLGCFRNRLETERDIVKQSGLYNAYITDCRIADDVYIAEVRNLANYGIEPGVVIENVASLVVHGETGFGNGTELEILNEGGGRELILYDRLSAPLAYMMVLYRHDKGFIEKLSDLIRAYAAAKKSTRGTIAAGAKILNCLNLRNLAVGARAVLDGVLHLEEGTIASTAEDPAYVGEGVIAKSFIIQSGSRVEGAAILDHSFVGQGVQVGRQFSAENSAIFANSEAFHGEATAIFAGPYTVTHHKSTLLISGLFSFYNAGSGSNQSNHMYKLGPVHQGILGRGSKTGSLSYLKWPCRVGLFSVVIGSHFSNFDISDIPFSYLFGTDSGSVLVPGVNLFTVGTRRDSQKWPQRDRRKGRERWDLINFELFNPYSVSKLLKGIRELEKLSENPESQEFIDYRGTVIKRSRLQKGIEAYETAIVIYIGYALIKQIEHGPQIKSFKSLREHLGREIENGTGAWADLAGMIAPLDVIKELMSEVGSEKCDSVSKFYAALAEIHARYEEYNWSFCRQLIEDRMGNPVAKLSKEQLLQMIEAWRDSQIRADEVILQDARKEFDDKSRIGYGIDGDEDIVERDFEAVRGSYDSNKFVQDIQGEMTEIPQKAAELIDFVKNLA